MDPLNTGNVSSPVSIPSPTTSSPNDSTLSDLASAAFASSPPEGQVSRGPIPPQSDRILTHSAWQAVISKDWAQLGNLLETLSEADINADPKQDPHSGTNLLRYAAGKSQWGLVNKLLDKCDKPDINIAPKKGQNAGKSLLWFAVRYNKCDLVNKMLDKCENPDINTAPKTGRHAGKSVLWFAAYFKQWDLVNKMLGKCENPDINAAPKTGANVNKSVLSFAEYYKQNALVSRMQQIQSSIRETTPSGTNPRPATQTKRGRDQDESTTVTKRARPTAAKKRKMSELDEKTLESTIGLAMCILSNDEASREEKNQSLQVLTTIAERLSVVYPEHNTEISSRVDSIIGALFRQTAKKRRTATVESIDLTGE